MRLLGIDYGTKKIGMAFADTDANVAVPLDVVPNVGEESVETFAKYIEEEDVDTIVVGLPIPDGDQDDTQLKRTRVFINALKKRVDIPVEGEDEGYTTAESIWLQEEKQSDVPDDALAAMLILRQYMNRID